VRDAHLLRVIIRVRLAAAAVGARVRLSGKEVSRPREALVEQAQHIQRLPRHARAFQLP
jgi:hypothetical protein